MAKVFEFDFRLGSEVEQFAKMLPTTRTGSPIFVANKTNCLKCNGTSDLEYTPVSYVCNVILYEFYTTGRTNASAYEMVMGHNDAAWGLWLKFTTTLLQLDCPSSSHSIKSALTSITAGRHQVIFNINGASSQIYYDGVPITTNITGTPTTTTVNKINIGSRSGHSSFFTGNIARVIGFSSLLTVQEVSYYYKQFLTSGVRKSETNKRKSPISINPDEAGLVCGWKFADNLNPLVDYKNGLILVKSNNPILSINGIAFSESKVNQLIYSSAISGMNVGSGNYSCEIIFKCNAIGVGSAQMLFMILYGGTDLLECYKSTTTLYAWSKKAAGGISTCSEPFTDIGSYHVVHINRINGYMFAYLDGIAFSTTNVLADISLVSHSSLKISHTTYPINATISSFKFNDLALSTSEITQKYNKFASRILWSENFDCGADEVVKNIPGWIPISGTWKVGELSTTDSVLKHLKTATPYKENVTIGSIYRQCTVAVGTFTCFFYKPDTANLEIHFVNTNRVGSTTNTGYYIKIDSSEAISVLEDNTEKFKTANSYIAANTWYELKVTNSVGGVRTTYIRGGSYGMIWTEMVESSGNNPFTDTTYMTSNCVLVKTDVVGTRTGMYNWIEGLLQ